jgi:hypothetical protein
MAAGLPDDERNSNLCQEAVAHARARTWLTAGAPIILIPPKIRRERPQLTPRFIRQWERMTRSTLSPPISVPYLPAILCIGAFSSDVLKARPNELASHLCIVWFQQTFALPIDPAVTTEIRQVAWEDVAAGRQ